MTDIKSISGKTVVELLAKSDRTDVATLACVDAFRQQSGTVFRLPGLPIEHILRIYRVSFGRTNWDPSTVLGADRFLPCVEAYRGAVIRFASLGFEGLGFSVWLNDSVSEVIACMVGRDRRVKERIDGDWMFTGSRLAR